MTGLASVQNQDRPDGSAEELSVLLKNIGRVKIQLSTIQNKTGDAYIQRQADLRDKLDKLLAEYTQAQKGEVPKVPNAQVRELPEGQGTRQTDSEKELELPATAKELQNESFSKESPASEEEPRRVQQQELLVPEASPVPKQDASLVQQPESPALEEEFSVPEASPVPEQDAPLVQQPESPALEEELPVPEASPVPEQDAPLVQQPEAPAFEEELPVPEASPVPEQDAPLVQQPESPALEEELPVPEALPVPEQHAPLVQQPESPALVEEDVTKMRQQDMGEVVGETASASKTLAKKLQGADLSGELQDKKLISALGEQAGAASALISAVGEPAAGNIGVGAATALISAVGEQAAANTGHDIGFEISWMPKQEPPTLLEQLPQASLSQEPQTGKEDADPRQQEESEAPMQQKDVSETPETAKVPAVAAELPQLATAAAAAENLQQELEEEALTRAAAAKAPVPEQATEAKQKEKQPSKKIAYTPVKQMPWGFGATAKSAVARKPTSPRQQKVERTPKKQSPTGRAHLVFDVKADCTVSLDEGEQATVAEAASGEAEAFEPCSPIDSLHTDNEDGLLPHGASMVSSASSWGKCVPTPGPSSSAGHGAMERRASQLARNVKAAQNRCLDGKVSNQHLQAAEAEVAMLRNQIEVRMQQREKIILQSPALSRDRSRSPDSSPARSPATALRMTPGDVLPPGMKPQSPGENTAAAVHTALFPQQSLGTMPSTPSDLSLSQRCQSLRLSSQSLPTGASAKRSSSSSPQGDRSLVQSPGFGAMNPNNPRTGSPPRKHSWSPSPEKPRPARKSRPPAVEEKRPVWDDRWHLIEEPKINKKSSLKETAKGQNAAKVATKSSPASRAQRPRSPSPTAEEQQQAYQQQAEEQARKLEEEARKKGSLMLRLAAVSPHSRKASSRRSSPKGQERVSKRLQEQKQKEHEQMLAARAAATATAACLSPRKPAVPAGKFAEDRAQRQAVANAEHRSR